MPNDNTVVVLRPELDRLFVLNLVERRIDEYVHHFFSRISCQNYAYFFCDSDLLCLHENGDHEDSRIMITYYEWPLPGKKTDKLKSVVQYIGGN